MNIGIEAPTQADRSQIPRGLLIGVQMVDGQPDFSRAATIHIPGQQPPDRDDRVMPEQASAPADRREAAQQRLNNVRAEALEAGITEAELKLWANMCRTYDLPHERKSAFITVTRGRGLSPEQARNLTLRYDKETTRARMQAPVYHYHQTGAAGFESIAAHDSVMSNEEQIATGIASGKSGSSRPDVVQFTRDETNRNGQLVPGISADVDMGRGGSVTLIFNESVMDDQDYDGAARYPNLPRVSLDHLAAAAVDKPEDIPGAVATLATTDRQDTPVLTRREWIDRYQ